MTFNFCNKKQIFAGFFLILTCSVIVGFLLLLAAFSIPAQPIERNALQARRILKSEGMYPHDTQHINSIRNNITDSLILLETMDQNNTGLIDRSLKIYKPIFFSPLGGIEDIMKYNSKRIDYQEEEYPRYWHGHLVIYKPLLYFFTYNTIKDIFSCLHIYLMLIIFIFLIKNKMSYMIIPYALTLFFFINPYYTGKNFHYSNCTFITSIITIILLIKNQKWKETPIKFFYLFFMTGIITSYIDLLSFPLITFGIPMYFYIFLNFSNPIKENIKKIFLYFISWGSGYAFMWCCKWVLIAFLTDINIVQDVTYQALYHSSHKMISDQENIGVAIYKVLQKNIVIALDDPLVYKTFLTGILGSLLFIIKNGQLKQLQLNLTQILPLSLFPFLWYVALSNHSSIHCWFTYKILSITYFSILGTFIYTACNKKRIKSSKKQILSF